ncbi:MAG: hypothetical protein V4510_12275 [bacterium]
MDLGKAAALTLLVAAALAGCSGKNDQGGPGASGSGCVDGFCITVPASPGDAYHFSASVSADNYTWDLGDNLGPAWGHDVDHTYDVQNSNLTVRLYAKSGSDTHMYERKGAIVRGCFQAPTPACENHRATFLLEAERNWFVTGEKAHFSAASSRDPDGDNMRFAWACQRNGPAVKLTPHSHGPMPPPFQAPPAGSVTSGVANHTLPAATLVLDASVDLCQALGSIGSQRLSTGATTLEGTFLQEGKYSMFLIAADPAHPTVSGQFDFVVTPPADRPALLQTWPFSGNFKAGAHTATGGAADVQTVCDAAMSGQTCDVFLGAVNMPLGATISWVNFTYGIGPGGSTVPPSGQNQAKWFLTKDGVSIANGGPGQEPVVIEAIHTPLGANYVMRITAEQGGNFDFQLQMQSKMDLDPYKLYF